MKFIFSLKQKLRLFSLFAVIFFFIFIPLSNKYANYKIAYNNSHLVYLADGYFNSIVYSTLDQLYELSDDPIRMATSNNGSLWAYTIFGIPISDPVGLISELINSVVFPLKYFLGGLIPFVLALLFGRIFCSWLCPMVFLNWINRKIRSFFDYLNIPLLNVKIDSSTRYFVFFFGLLFSYLSGAWVWHYILPYIAITHELFSVIIFSTFTVAIYFLLGIVLVDIALIPQEFCKKICPTGMLLSSFNKIQIFKVKVDNTQCPSGCHVCYDVCPIDLYPKNQSLYSCHSCSICIDNCPSQILEFGINPMYLKRSQNDKSLEKLNA